MTIEEPKIKENYNKLKSLLSLNLKRDNKLSEDLAMMIGTKIGELT